MTAAFVCEFAYGAAVGVAGTLLVLLLWSLLAFWLAPIIGRMVHHRDERG